MTTLPTSAFIINELAHFVCWPGCFWHGDKRVFARQALHIRYRAR
ncbi:hypothetical protein ACSG74_002905 [Cronobacter sakazakii]|nr:hypothetical protein [Cronobacter sakazakii]